MRKIISIIFVITLFCGCSENSSVYRNPYIPDYHFSIEINLNLPSYSNLRYTNNPILITQQGVGVKGIFVTKVNNIEYRAFEANCPNQYPKDCSLMILKGINAICPCDNLSYNLITGMGQGEYSMKPYKVQVYGDIVKVYN